MKHPHAKQDRQCKYVYNVSVWRVGVTIVETQQLFPLCIVVALNGAVNNL